jgi:hypothetical protein
MFARLVSLRRSVPLLSTAMWIASISLLFAAARFEWPEVSCTVHELLSTKLLNAYDTGFNTALLRPYGHTRLLLRNNAEFGNWTQRDRIDAIERSLQCVERLLNESERWWVMAGSLVGANRHSALAPHDEDADVMLPRADFQRFIARLERMKRLDAPSFYSAEDKKTWRRLGPKLAHFSDGDSCAVLKRPADSWLVAQVVDLPSGFYTDVWVGDVDEECLQCPWCVPTCVPLDVVFPLRRERFGSLMLPMPNRIKEYLSFEYPDFEHPCDKLMQLALFTRLPSRVWLLFLATVAAGSCLFVQTRRRLVHALLIIFVGIWSVWPTIDCAGRFACVGAMFAASIVCFHLAEKRNRNVVWMVGVCSASLLLFGCLFAIRTFLAMTIDGYECQSGIKSARLLELSAFDVDYRMFWNGLK